MVLLSASYVERECTRAKLMKSLTCKGTEAHRLRKLSHLYMNEKFITAIGDLSVCKSLKVIYLQCNRIARIQNLDFAENLTHLYLQHNELTKIENLEGLGSLTTLCLGYNRICVVEGLEKLSSLYDLQIENQQLLAGECLIFEPQTLEALSGRLEALNVSGNRIQSLRPLSKMKRLEILEAKDNTIDDMEDLTESISNLERLSKLDLRGNSVTRSYRYRENVIANSELLESLDGKRITEVSREFMKKFEEEKEHRRNQRRDKMTLSDDITSSLKLPPAFERSVSRAIIQQHPGPKFTFNVTSASADSQPQVFPAWKSAAAVAGTKSSSSSSSSRIAPRPFWRGETIGKPSLRKITEIASVFPTL